MRDAKAQREKDALRAQMDVERRQRELLEDAQEKEKAAAQAAVFDTFQALGAPPAAAGPAPPPQPPKQPPPPPPKEQPAAPAAAAAAAAAAPAPPRAAAAAAPQQQPAAPDPRRAIFPAAASGDSGGGGSGGSAPLDDGVGAPLPAPRASLLQRVPVAFTPRAFATPLRESKQKEEEDWLARNYGKIKEAAAAGKAAGSVRHIEKDAGWLKEKAEGFAAVGDWDSAASAFGSAIVAAPEDPVLLLNRAACHLRRLRAGACEADATAALALLLRGWWGAGAGAGAGGAGAGAAAPPPPRCPPEAEARALGALGAAAATAPVERARALAAKALARRLAARGLSGAFRAALADCDAAAALAGGAGGGAELAPARAALAPLAEAEALKAAADGAAGGGDAEAALAGYAAALAAAPGYVAAHLNRAALLLALKRGAECVADCEAALALLAAPGAGGGAEALPRATPAPGTELAAQCSARAVARRDAARALEAGGGAA